MDNAFELASKTPIAVAELRAADSRGFRGTLFNHYVQDEPTAAPQAVASVLGDLETLEEQIRAAKPDPAHLYTLALLFRQTLPRPQPTDVPGHGTVNDVSIADGPLGVQQNLLVEGTLLVAGDLTVGGQIIVGEGAVVVVTGSLHASALAATGHVSVGGDVRAMFMEVSGSAHALDVGGVIDSFLLIQNDHVVRAAEYSVGVHAVYPRADAAAEVFQRDILGADGQPDWTAVARAARAGDDIFLDGYRPPEPAAGTLLQVL